MFMGTLSGSFQGSAGLAVVLGIIYHIIFLMCVQYAFRVRESDAQSANATASTTNEDALRRSLGIESVTDFSDGEELRVCRTCRCKKPSRTHHCSICKRCILKMDHHCPWVGNCVGFGNYKFFVLFLFWTAVMGLYMSVSLLPVIVTYSTEHGSVHHMVTFIMGGVFGMALAAFFYSHLRLMLQNMTTLESMSSNELITVTYAWNVGKMANVKQVLGNNYLLWLLPVPTSTGDGISWPQRYADQTNERERLIDGAVPASDGDLEGGARAEL